MTNNGILYVIAAPSGAGKTTLVQNLCTLNPTLIKAISYTTRPKRPGEVDGVHYNFISSDQFQTLMQQDAFLEYATVYQYYYGSDRAWVMDKLQQGKDVALEIDWQGAIKIKQMFPAAVAIYILPPSLTALKERLISRKQDPEEIIAYRLQHAQNDIAQYKKFDYIVINDNFQQATEDLMAIIKSHNLRLAVQEVRNKLLLATLLA